MDFIWATRSEFRPSRRWILIKNDRNDRKEKGTDLRKQAEKQLVDKQNSPKKKTSAPLADIDMQRPIQELQIHQIELEMQNEELKQAHDEAEVQRKRYLDLYYFAPVGYFTLDSASVIRQLNLAGAHLLGRGRSDLLNCRLENFIVPADVPVFDVFLNNVFTHRLKETCAVWLGPMNDRRTYVHIEATVSGDGRECRTVVVDVTAQKKAEDDLHQLQDGLEHLVTRRTTQLAEAVQVSTWPTPINCSASSNGCTAPKNMTGRESVWRSPSASSLGTAAGSGRKVKLTKERRFISRCRSIARKESSSKEAPRKNGAMNDEGHNQVNG